MKFSRKKKNLYFDDLSVNDSKPYGSHFPPIRLVFKKYQRDCLGQNAFTILSILHHFEDCLGDLSVWEDQDVGLPWALPTTSLRKSSWRLGRVFSTQLKEGTPHPSGVFAKPPELILK